MMLDIDPKEKKRRGAGYFELPEDIAQEWVKEHQAALVAEQRDKINKKFEKDNEKLIAEGGKKMSGKELDERLEVADDLEKKFKKENKTKKVEAEGKGPSVEKLEANLEKLNDRIATMKVQAEDKEENKEVALGTSKIVSSSQVSRAVLVLTTLELHRSSLDGCVCEKVQRSHRKVLLQDSS